MGNVGSTGKSQTPRQRSVSSREEKQALLEPALKDGGSTVGKLDRHSKFDFEQYSHSHEKGEKPKVSLLISSSPPRIEHGVDELDVLVKADEPSQGPPPYEKLDLLKDEKPASSQTDIKLIRAGPFTSYRYSSSIPFGNGAQRKEFEFWIRENLGAQHKINSYGFTFSREVNDCIGVEFLPFNQINARRKERKEFLQAIVAHAEQNVNEPVIAQSYPPSPHETIFARRLVTPRFGAFIRLENVPRGSKLADTMSMISRSTLRGVYENCGAEILNSKIMRFAAYRSPPKGKKRPEFAKLGAQEIEEKLLRVLMEKITEFQSEGVDIHHIVADSEVYLELLARVQAGFETELGAKLIYDVMLDA
jgi:hypothetical protein